MMMMMMLMTIIMSTMIKDNITRKVTVIAVLILNRSDCLTVSTIKYA